MSVRDTRWLIPLPLQNAGNLLLFTACDSHYLQYAISLLRSVDLYSPGLNFVLHIINPDAPSFSRIDAVAKSLNNTGLAVSYETTDLSGLNEDQQKAYYACARFAQLAELIKGAKYSVFSLDADSLVVNPFDMDFSDKGDADIVIVRRDLVQDTPTHLSILTGSIWFKPSNHIDQLLKAVSEKINDKLANRSINWFDDQIIFYEQMQLLKKKIRSYNLKRKYADWDFSENSIVWAGKGPRKESDMRFFLLQGMLTDNKYRSSIAMQLWKSVLSSRNSFISSSWLNSRLSAARLSPARRISLFVPRLDLPWSRERAPSFPPPSLSEDILDLRLHWKKFAVMLANALERAGLTVDVNELPANEINLATVDTSSACFALIPHRCRLDWQQGTTPTMFYMQEYFRWVFVLNSEGWSAASSIYPVKLESLPEQNNQCFDRYRRLLSTGGLGSKFAQNDRRTKKQLLADRSIPSDRNLLGIRRNLPYIFFPLQIPHDQSIQYFSDLSEQVIVEHLVDWARKHGVPVVMKPHPANIKSMEFFKRFVDGETVLWSDAHVHDLITHAHAIYTVNSGVGFESLLHIKPIVTFGRAEYDCVTFNATIDTLDEAWNYCLEESAETLELKYRRFFNWFLTDYAIDMSQPELAAARLDQIAGEIATRLAVRDDEEACA